jgi:hypothetical protein
MDTKADILCRRIELYRRYLRGSVDAALIFDYFREIVERRADRASAVRHRPEAPALDSVI